MATRRVRTTRVEVSSKRGVFMISVAAELAEMHPQTLRMYEARGLIEPQRSPKGTRLYSTEDVERLRRIQEMTAELGMNLAGVERVFELEEQLAAMAAKVAALEQGDLARHRVELLFELEHLLDAGQVHAQLGGHLLDATESLDVLVGVQARALRGALGLDQPASLVHAQRLRVHLGQLSGHGDHEHAPLRGHLDPG